MRTFSLLSIAVVIFVAGCINSGEVSRSQFGSVQISDNQDLFVEVQASEEVRQGRNITTVFTVSNKRETPVDSVSFRVYDMCGFVGDSQKEFSLRSMETVTWNWKWLAPFIDFTTDCNVKFRVEYFGKNTMTHDVVVLDATEFYNREQQGTLNEIDIDSQQTAAPVSLGVTFSQSQPLLDGEKGFVFINYQNSGSGIATELSPGSVIISAPASLDGFNCAAYNLQDGKHVLRQPLRFLNDNAPQSTCEYTAKSSQPVDSASLTITATYKYTLDDSFIVKIKTQ